MRMLNNMNPRYVNWESGDEDKTVKMKDMLEVEHSGSSRSLRTSCQVRLPGMFKQQQQPQQGWLREQAQRAWQVLRAQQELLPEQNFPKPGSQEGRQE